MERNNSKDAFQDKLEHIKLDLGTYKVFLHFQNHKEPFVIHFNKPSRKFYFSLIALIVIEMKDLNKPGFIHIRKHEKALKLLDNSLAGHNASKTKAVALNPNSAESHLRLGKIFIFARKWKESIPEYKTAMRLNPIPPSLYFWSIGLCNSGDSISIIPIFRFSSRFVRC